jgi:hypothetical protein
MWEQATEMSQKVPFSAAQELTRRLRSVRRFWGALGLSLLAVPALAGSPIIDRLGRDSGLKAFSDGFRLPDRMDLPVSWRQTRARVRGTGVSTQSESFRETWQLTSDGSGGGWLASDRAKVHVIKQIESGAQPFSLIIEEEALAKLIGLVRHDVVSMESGGAVPALVKIGLSSSGDVVKFNVNLPGDVHYAIQFQIGESGARSL